MKVENSIKSKLQTELDPSYMVLINESYMHSVPPNSETHFNLTLVSPEFEGKRQVARHQLIYAVLAEEMRSGVHALALHTFTDSEWNERNEPTAASPNCLGGSKEKA